ncbi:hypothetical protein [Halorarius litoreus]|uniref:hypothetical protein n=1 Tax=Halorarius litoreus TaxID=2962676 RepID=UPI0020CD2562|nr:hypothetical protein [Halorarius litoreus]
MSAASVSARSRRFVAAGAVLFVLWGAASAAGAPRRVQVVLGLQGAILLTAFGKAHALVPSYFDRELTPTWSPAVTFPLAAGGVLALAGGLWADVTTLEAVGAGAWALGAVGVAATLVWTVRDNLTGGDTGTSETNADRRFLDRTANAVVPVALAYLLAGAYATAAGHTPLPPLVDGYPPRASHLLAAGVGVLLVLGVGFRLFPRFLAARPPNGLPQVALLAGAVGPALLALGVPTGPLLVAGSIVETVAVVGFATTFLVLFARSERRRVGFYGVATGAVAGLVGVGLGLQFAFVGLDAALVTAHLRVNLLGFLGLTVMGAAYQFYPPAVGTFPGASDRTALASIALVAGGLLVELAGVALGQPAVTVGRLLALAGVTGYAYLVLGLFRERYW